MNQFTQPLRMSRETKGTVVYEDGEDGRNPIRSVYIAKSAFPKGAYPKELLLTITEPPKASQDEL